MLSGDREKNEALNDGFPLFIGGEYDFSFPKAFWKVGLLSSCPSSLKKKIAASLLSEQLGLKSVDNVVRTYLKDVRYSEGDDGRLDLRVREFVTQRMRAFSSQIQVISKKPEKELNRAMSEWTLGRTSFSMELLAYCGQRGALFEALAIARMMLEQIAWAYNVGNSKDGDAVVHSSGPASISELKRASTFAGRLYGWLSIHAHWTFEAHKKSVITSGGGKVGHLFASSYFKAVVFCVMILLVVAAFECSWAMYPELHKLKAEKGARTTIPDDVKREAIQLLSQIVACDPEDRDLRQLSSMLTDEPR